MTAKLTSLVLFGAIGLTGCGGGAPIQTAEAELPTLNVTHWTDATELFMEYPPLVTGRSALFAVHLTKLVDFTPVDAGQTRDRVHARGWRRAEGSRRAATITARSVQSGGRPPDTGALSLGAGS